MSPEHRINRKLSTQDEKDAWDAYASAALNALITSGGGTSNAAAVAADYATLMLEERRKAFPDKRSSATSEPLNI